MSELSKIQSTNLEDLRFLEKFYELPILPEFCEFVIWTKAQKKLVLADKRKYFLVAHWIKYKLILDCGEVCKSPIEHLSGEERQGIEALGNYLYFELKAISEGWDTINKFAISQNVSIPFCSPREYFLEVQREVSFKTTTDWFSQNLTEGGQKYWTNRCREFRQFLKKRHKDQAELEEEFLKCGWGEFWIVAILRAGMPKRKTNPYYRGIWAAYVQAQQHYNDWVSRNPPTGWKFRDGEILESGANGGRSLKGVEL